MFGQSARTSRGRAGAGTGASAVAGGHQVEEDRLDVRSGGPQCRRIQGDREQNGLVGAQGLREEPQPVLDGQGVHAAAPHAETVRLAHVARHAHSALPEPPRQRLTRQPQVAAVPARASRKALAAA